jgi:hypothetical protein
MGIWQQLTGKKTHCAGCGVVVPVTPENKFEETYCSETCRTNVRRLSSIPPPAPGGGEQRAPRYPVHTMGVGKAGT